MANTENKGVSEDGNHRIEIATLFHELRIAVEALLMGIKTLLQKPEAAPVVDQLGILATLAHQGAETIAALDTALQGLLQQK